MWLIINYLETIIKLIGIMIIIIGFTKATIQYLDMYLHNQKNCYIIYRQNLAKATLLGLEFLIAGDIINSVTEKLTIQSATSLMLIILIRLILTWELQREIEGKFPWQKKT